MKIKLTTKLMKNTFSKLLTKIIYNKMGIDMNIQIDKLEIQVKDGETTIKTNVEVKLDNDEFRDLIKTYS